MKLTKASSPGWTCPVCGRQFDKKSQAHSCKVSSLETHLSKGSALALQIYSALERVLRELGDYRAVPTKTSISLMARTSFGGLAIRKNHLVLGFILTREIEHPRLRTILQISPRTFAYKVELRSAEEVDKQLRAWLKEAYQVGLAAGRR